MQVSQQTPDPSQKQLLDLLESVICELRDARESGQRDVEEAMARVLASAGIEIPCR